MEPNEDIIIGISKGEFLAPANQDSEAFIDLSNRNNGINNRFEWGVGIEGSFSSLLQFDGQKFFGAKLGEPFEVGQIFYRNGEIRRSFSGNFGFNVTLDIEGIDNDPAPFEYTFNILTVPNRTGDPVLDADRLRFVSSGLLPQTFELNDKIYTLDLLGFSQDGGQTFERGFNSPEEGFDIASLYGNIILIADNTEPTSGTGTQSFFTFLSVESVVSLQSKNAVFIGGDGTGTDAIAGSVLVSSSTQLNLFWSISTSAALSFQNGSFLDLSSASLVSLSQVSLSQVSEYSGVAIGSNGDDNVIATVDSDIIDCAIGNDILDLNDGNDLGRGNQGNDFLGGGEGNDILNGNQHSDRIMGGFGNDIVRGGQGSDMVMGQDGDDIIFGDYGEDTLIGGEGSDTFVLRTQTDASGEFALSLDYIEDFELGIDRIRVDRTVSLTYEISDFNSDGSSDVVISLENSFAIGVVLNTTNVNRVQVSVDFVPQDDFLLTIG